MKDITTKTKNEVDMMDYDDMLRFSPAGSEGPPEPYRCPVSTPAGNRRPIRKNTPNAYVTFTNMNRSMQIPKSSSLPKHCNTRKLYKPRGLTNAPTKNFDCYYVNTVQNTVHIDSQSDPSTWLNSLCSQPVDEIFTKYKRRSEASDMRKNTGEIRNVSTPGEKALINAWSSNTSQRGTYSSLSRSSAKTTFSSDSRNSKQSTYDNRRIFRIESRSDCTTTVTLAPIFALMPVPVSPQKTPRESQNISPIHLDRKNNLHNNKNNFVQESSLLFDSSIYELHQRDRRFPDIKVRQRSMTPTRKRVSSEPGGVVKSSNYSERQNLQESAMHVISIGHIFDNKEPPVLKPLLQTCSYRLPKNVSTSLPELQGTAFNDMAT